MDNKLTQLTQTLYDEGLAKGRQEGERIVSDANLQASKILEEANAKAKSIQEAARIAAEDLREKTLGEIRMAGRQAVASIKEEITELVVTGSVAPGVKAAGMDPAFVKAMLLEMAKSGGSVVALLPEIRKKDLEAEFARSAAELLAAGVEVGYSPAVKSGFRVVPKDGGYYVSFEDENFEALLSGYLRGVARGVLFGE